MRYMLLNRLRKVKHPFYSVLVSFLLSVVLLTSLPQGIGPSLSSTKAHAATSNAIVLENQQAGSTAWQFDTHGKATNHEIEGYASLSSVNQGSQISFMVSLSSSAQYIMDIYRMGYYAHGTNPDGSACVGPCGARLMQHVGPLNGSKQASCPTTTSGYDLGLVECSWTPSYTLTVPTTWTTGNYIIKLSRSDTGIENYMTFVVRNDNAVADIVYSMDVTTWQAYNYWGGAGNNNIGNNLYGQFNDVSQKVLGDTRAYTVSLDRPYMDQGAIDGAGNYMLWDYPMTRWLEAHGYNVTYVTSVDLESNPNLLSGRKVFMNTGHDEYYSDNMRANIQNGINAGVNMAFFSANNMGFRILWQTSSTGQSYRQVHIDKGAIPSSNTNWWRYLTPPQPENAILGVMQNGVATARPFLVYDPTSWIYNGTGLVKYNGTVVTSGAGQNAIDHLVGYEFDERAANDPKLAAFIPYEPAGLQQVGHSFVPASDNGVDSYSDATIYTAASGAMVFSAGTIQWSWGVDNGFNDSFCSCNLGFANSASQQITSNILNKFIGTPISAPAVSLNPTSVGFSAQTVNTTSSTQSVTLSNSGTSALAISSIALSGTNSSDFAQTNTCPTTPSTLSTGSSCTISVTFKPTVTGSRSASITFTDNAAGGMQTLALSGIGIPQIPTASLDTTSVSFGNQDINTTSAASKVTLTNNGLATLAISSIVLSGTNSSDFAQTNTCPMAPSTLSAGSSCTMSVTFKPTAAGSRSASITLTDNAANGTQGIDLSGTGNQKPTVSLSTTSVNFGSQKTGTTSAASTVTLTDNSPTALAISGIALSGTNGGDFTQTNTCQSTLASTTSCTISITFTPSASGSRSASVTIMDNAGNSPQSIVLTGTGVAPVAAATFSSNSINFGNGLLFIGSATQTVTLTNTGTAVLNVARIALTGANANDFAQMNNCPATLAVNATCTISLRFTAQALGMRNASLTLTSNAANSPQTIALNGNGTLLLFGWLNWW